MTPLVLAMVLGSAVMHASWNAMVKSGGDRLARMALLNFVCGVLALPMLMVTALPAPAAWPYIALSVVLHNIYYTLLLQAYRFGDLSFAYPLARGSAPLFVAIGSYLLAGERLSPIGIAAVAMICAAILSLALSARGQAGHGWQAVVAALATGTSIGAYSLSDGLGARISRSPLGYVGMLFALESLPLLIYVLIRRRTALAATWNSSWRTGLFGGTLAFTGYAVVVWAMTRTPLTFVSALRETSVIIAALIGTRLLGEPFGLRRVAAATAVAAGIVLLQLAPAA